MLFSCFFFFKQKTAYEMRISDWSSDVCSSDLAIIVGIDPTSIAISLAVNVMIEFLLSSCDQQDMETGMLRGSGMCVEVGSYCSSKILGICVQKSRSHCCFNTKLGRIIQRSEAHTSELQSLMRNSYAVFCLKKQTN